MAPLFAFKMHTVPPGLSFLFLLTFAGGRLQHRTSIARTTVDLNLQDL